MITAETVRTVARRGATAIVRTRTGLTLAAAGVDHSNVEPGSVLLLPVDPDASADRLRAALQRAHRAAARSDHLRYRRPAVAGRADRPGDRGRRGAGGPARTPGDRRLRQPAARSPRWPWPTSWPAAADLVKGKLDGRPVAVVRGLAGLVGEPGGPAAGAGPARRRGPVPVRQPGGGARRGADRRRPARRVRGSGPAGSGRAGGRGAPAGRSRGLGGRPAGVGCCPPSFRTRPRLSPPG